MEPVKFGIVGIGGFGRTHVRAIEDLECGGDREDRRAERGQLAVPQVAAVEPTAQMSLRPGVSTQP